MTVFIRRILGALGLDAATFEEVEADRSATGQAMLVVVLASIGAGIGNGGIGASAVPTIVYGTAASLLAWATWAALIYYLGTRVLPESGDANRSRRGAAHTGICGRSRHVPGLRGLRRHALAGTPGHVSVDAGGHDHRRAPGARLQHDGSRTRAGRARLGRRGRRRHWRGPALLDAGLVTPAKRSPNGVVRALHLRAAAVLTHAALGRAYWPASVRQR